ncbi:MAG: hypothetical protein JKY37_15520 [Nannocystaceae bacterium]|nr:hypothetical protein [Nannocystaceae bacterium]
MRPIAALGLLTALACDGGVEPVKPGVEAATPDAAPSAALPAATAAPESREELADDEARAKRYAQIADGLEADAAAATAGKVFASSQADLQSILDRADDRFLRINAAILLGHMLELRGDRKGAIAYWRHATKLVPSAVGPDGAGPDDAGPFMALALGLAGDKQFKAAAVAQATASALDPNNLENWLALGELRIRAGDPEAAATAYVDYERVRASLVNGLTGRKKADGAFFVSPDERIACARNLAAAIDAGTAMALLYSLQTEPEHIVRMAVAQVMGEQRLQAYAPRLKAQIKTESDGDTKTVMQWALAEIGRDPVLVNEDDAARLPKDDPRAAEGDPREGLPEAKPPSRVQPSGSATLGTPAATPDADADPGSRGQAVGPSPGADAAPR